MLRPMCVAGACWVAMFVALNVAMSTDFCNEGASGKENTNANDTLSCSGRGCDPESPCELKSWERNGVTYVWCDCEDWVPDDPLELGCTVILVKRPGEFDDARCNAPSSCPGLAECATSPISLRGEFTCFCPQK